MLQVRLAIDLVGNQSILKIVNEIYIERHPSQTKVSNFWTGIGNLYRGVVPTFFGMTIYAGLLLLF